MALYLPVTWRFKLAYGLLFAAIGIFYPYLALYFQAAGLPGAQIGIILGIPPLVGIVVQPLWGMLSDVYHVHRYALALASIGTAASAWLYNTTTNFHILVLLTLLLAVMRSPLVFLCDALALDYLETQGRRQEYGSLRLWGSIGFAFSSFVIGALVIGNAVLRIMPLYALTMIALALLAFTLPTARPTGTSKWWEGITILQQKPMLLKFLVGVLLMGMTLGTVNQYLIVYLTEIHTPGWVSGTTFALAALGEAPLMAAASSLITRWGLRLVFIGGIAVLPLRWLLYIFIREPLLMIPIQFFHSISMLSLLVVGVLYVDQQLTREWRATGQALYQTMLQGIGAGLGTFAAGIIYGQGGMVPVWWMCLGINILGVSVIMWAGQQPVLSRVEEGARP